MPGSLGRSWRGARTSEISPEPAARGGSRSSPPGATGGPAGWPSARSSTRSGCQRSRRTERVSTTVGIPAPSSCRGHAYCTASCRTGAARASAVGMTHAARVTPPDAWRSCASGIVGSSFPAQPAATPVFLRILGRRSEQPEQYASRFSSPSTDQGIRWLRPLLPQPSDAASAGRVVDSGQTDWQSCGNASIPIHFAGRAEKEPAIVACSRYRSAVLESTGLVERGG